MPGAASRNLECNDVRVPESPAAAQPDLQSPAAEPGGRTLLVVSHPAVVSANQAVYAELARRGWRVRIVLPSNWSHGYSQGPIAPRPLPGLEDALLPARVLLPGKAQRHLYLARAGAIVRREAPAVAFLEEEPFALATAQWGRALARAGVPFGVQCYENIDRELPAPVRALRSRALARAAFVAARSATAAELARAWGARGAIGLAPPAVPMWEEPPAGREGPPREYTIGFAGRLIDIKGLDDLLAAVRRLQAPVRLLLIGEGDMRARLEGQEIPGSRVEVISDLTHEQMAEGYARLDVLALPSHTTPTWKEQFGRVIVEALSCGVPVVGSDSGEIPWLIGLTGGGLVFPEGDVAALAECLQRLREDEGLRRELAAAGAGAVQRLFSVPAATDALERLLAAAALPA